MFSFQYNRLFPFKYVWLFLFLAIAKPVFQQETKLEVIDYSNLSPDSILRLSQEYLERSKPDNALPLLFGLIDTVELNSDVSHLSRIFVAEGYREKNEYIKGRTVLEEVLRSERLDEKNRAFAYNRLAALYGDSRGLSLNSSDTIIKYSELCLEISREFGFEDYIASSLNELGYVYLIQKDYKKAGALFLESYQRYKSMHMSLYAMAVAVNVSKVYLSQSEHISAIQVIEEAMNMEDPVGNENIFMRLNLQLAVVYKSKNDYKKAYNYMSKARGFQRRFYLDRINKEITEMSAKYDLKLQKSFLKEEELKKDNALKNKMYWILISSFLLILLISFISIYFLRKKNIEQKNALINAENKHLKFSLDHKCVELSSSIAFNVSQNNTLIEIKKILQEEDAKSAIDLINKHINTELKWGRFSAKFEDMHPDFSPRLIQVHEDLTKGEIKLAMLLYIGLKSKEIAEILNITESAVSKNRQRLRKKIKLQETDNLTSYFKSL